MTTALNAGNLPNILFAGAAGARAANTRMNMRRSNTRRMNSTAAIFAQVGGIIGFALTALPPRRPPRLNQLLYLGRGFVEGDRILDSIQFPAIFGDVSAINLALVLRLPTIAIMLPPTPN